MAKVPVADSLIGDIYSIAGRDTRALEMLRPITERGRELVAQTLSHFGSARVEMARAVGETDPAILHQLANLDAVQGVSPAQRSFIARLWRPGDLELLRASAMRMADSLDVALKGRMTIRGEQLYRIASAVDERLGTAFRGVRSTGNAIAYGAKQAVSVVGGGIQQVRQDLRVVMSAVGAATAVRVGIGQLGVLLMKAGPHGVAAAAGVALGGGIYYSGVGKYIGTDWLGNKLGDFTYRL